jgi:hypothetical protein
MKYTLVDGSQIELNNIFEVSEIKDNGFDSQTIDQSTISFVIRFKSGRSKKVSKNYHFSDWFKVYKELKTIRDELVNAWQSTRQARK